MNKRFGIYYCFLGLISLNICAQQSADKYQGDKVRLTKSEKILNTSYYYYNPSVKIYAIYKDTTDAVNAFPEQLLTSIFSSTNVQWDQYNTYGKKVSPKNPNHYNNIRNMDKTKNYWVLHFKYQFDYDNIPSAIVKFYIHMDGQKPLSAAMILQKINNRWYQTSIPSYQELTFMIMRFKSDKLQQLFDGTITGDQTMDALIKKTRGADGGIDMDKLFKEYSTWYGQVTDQINVDYFIDKNAF